LGVFWADFKDNCDKRKAFLFFSIGLGCGNSLQQAATQQPSSAATPNITQVLPQVIPAGSQATTLKVTGTNFQVRQPFSGTAPQLKTTAVDANTLTGSIGSSSLATPATVS